MKKPLLLAAALLLLAVAADAAPLKPPSVCAGTLSVTDVTLDGQPADATFGPVCGANPKLDDLDVVFGGGWEAFLTSDEATTKPWADLPWEWSVDFTPGAVQGQGTWAFNIAAGPAVRGDFAVVLKAGNDWAAYLFEDVTMTSGSEGTYAVRFTNGGNNFSALSHMALAVREPASVSEPGALFLFGLGLMFVGFRFRRPGQ